MVVSVGAVLGRSARTAVDGDVEELFVALKIVDGARHAATVSLNSLARCLSPLILAPDLRRAMSDPDGPLVKLGASAFADLSAFKIFSVRC